mgnify:CR=1 FL=1
MTLPPIDEAHLRAALDDADVPALLPAVAYLTGDLTVLRDDLRFDPALMLQPDAGMTAAQMSEARDLAATTLLRFWADGGTPAAPPDSGALQQMLDFAVGGGAPMDEYLPLFQEELGIEGDLRAPRWQKDDIAPDSDFQVAVIGAGMSGLAAAHRLQQAGVPFVVFEKNADVGGTWLENTYPGCRVDVSNHLYSYSFAQRHEWPHHFSTQEVLLDYFRACADEFGLRPSIRFETEVVSATFDDATCAWAVVTRDRAGREETHTANAVISAVGQLNRPNMPDIAGMDTFAGPAFHSARWDHDVDLTGQRVAVIGTGASAAQFITCIAEDVAELTIYQRTPNWLVPTPDYHDEVSDGLRWLLRNLPSFAEWYRFWLFWRSAEGMLPGAIVDPEWNNGGLSVSMLNEFLRQLLVAYLQTEFADAPDLLPAVVPDYPPAAKRVIRDNGVWARTLKRDNVTLVTDRIAEITEKGVRTADGVERPADVIIYGTGFTASQFLTPMAVTGRGGVDLHQQWHGDARAYLGITVPGFPNLFCLYGPNTNIVINGSIVYFSECEVNYVLESIRMLLEGGHRAMDCRPDVHDAYNSRIDEANRLRAWGASSVNSWYKNSTGRVSQNWPYALLEYWEQTRRPNPDDYVLT